jgi:membrane protein YdbS with pleckstrin-like domain
MKAPTRPPEPPAGSHGKVQVYRASPSYLTYRLLGFWLVFSAIWLIVWSLIFAGIIGGEPAVSILGFVAMPILALVQLCVYFAVRIDYDMRYYIVTDRSLRVREGAFIVKEKTISYANVQNIRVVQGPLLRFFGIWHLKVDTAGGGAVEKGKPGAGAHRVQMAGIENAHEVRDSIQSQLRQRGIGAGLGDLDDHDERGRGTVIATAELRDALRELQQATSALRAAVGSRG